MFAVCRRRFAGLHIHSKEEELRLCTSRPWALNSCWHGPDYGPPTEEWNRQSKEVGSGYGKKRGRWWCTQGRDEAATAIAGQSPRRWKEVVHEDDARVVEGGTLGFRAICWSC